MSIKKYTNFENIDKRKDNEGKYILDKDFNIISKNQTENVDFGECGTDVMEVSVYDINNNLIQQKNGQNVTYIRSGDIKNYLYKISRPNKALANGEAFSEIAIDAERLLNDLGFENGILKLNINFVRNRVGTENKIRRAWIQEISPSRQEIRILPLKTNNKYFDDLNQKELKKLKNLNKDFKFYKKSILDSLNKFENQFLEKIDEDLITKYGNDFLNLAKKDFGLRNFGDLKKSIMSDFKTSVDYYLSNRAYDVTKTNFGLSTAIRFIDCDQYEFEPIVAEMENILNNCVKYNLAFLKRRDFDIRNIPKEFKQVDLTPDIENIKNVLPPKDEITVVYDTSKFRIEKPINGDTPVVYAQPENLPTRNIVPPIIIDVVKVNPIAKSFTYHIQNKDSRSSASFKFFDATGTSVEKILAPGASAKICAIENSVSAATYRTNTVKTGLGKFVQNIGEKDDMQNFIIKKEEACSVIKVGTGSPKPVGGYVSGYNTTANIPVRETNVNVPVSGYTTTNSTLPTNVATTNPTITAQDRGGGGGVVVSGYTVFNSTPGFSIGGYQSSNRASTGQGF